MDAVIEAGGPQKSTTTTPVVNGGEVVTIPKQEFDDLQHRAGVSSQNFERLKKAQEDIADLESKIAELQARPDPSGDNSEALGKLAADLAELKAKQVKSEVLETYPQLKEVMGDFESFVADENNKGMSLKTAAKAFLTEKGLLDPTRKGLERPTGGDRAPAPTGTMTAEDAKKLRETDYKKYRELVKKGIIKVG